MSEVAWYPHVRPCAPPYPVPMDHSDRYAYAFRAEPGQCFRMVVSSEPAGASIRCPNRVEWRGSAQDGGGVWHLVESCMDHAGDLTDWRPVGRR